MKENLHLHLVQVWQNIFFCDHLTLCNDFGFIKSRLAHCMFCFQKLSSVQTCKTKNLINNLNNHNENRSASLFYHQVNVGFECSSYETELR